MPRLNQWRRGATRESAAGWPAGRPPSTDQLANSLFVSIHTHTHVSTRRSPPSDHLCQLPQRPLCRSHSDEHRARSIARDARTVKPTGYSRTDDCPTYRTAGCHDNAKSRHSDEYYYRYTVACSMTTARFSRDAAARWLSCGGCTDADGRSRLLPSPDAGSAMTLNANQTRAHDACACCEIDRRWPNYYCRTSERVLFACLTSVPRYL